MVEVKGDQQCAQCRYQSCHLGKQGKWGAPGSQFESHWYCDDCWRQWDEEVLPCHVDEDYEKLVEIQRLLGPVRLSCSLPTKGPFPLSEFNINSSSETFIGNMERLYEDVVVGPALHPDEACLDAFFSSLAASSVFRDLWAGERRGPCLLPVPFVRNLLTLDDIQHGLSAQSGRKPCECALTLTDGRDFRCPISLPPICKMSSMLEILEYGTIFLNTASLHWKAAAELCLAASRAFQFPSNINVYVTGCDREVSTDVHTDNHDVLIFHSQGAKRWRIYAPPARRGAQGHPLYRGKNEDRLLDEELGSLLLDVILTPGQVLFVPMGFPHATGTAGAAGKGGASHEEVSVHLTLGLSTADYEFCLGGLRKAWVQDKSWTAKAEDALPDPLWWRLLAPMPVGFLAQGNGVKTSMALVQNIAQQLLEVLRATGELRQGTRVEEVEELVMKHLSRQVAVLTSQEEAYREVISSSDGIFLATGPEDTCSEYRRSMLCHQIAEDERKRSMDSISDPRYVKRIDPSDGIARSLAELKQRFQGRMNDEQLEIYWEQCPSLYPQDQPPLELLHELQRASQNCKDLLYFLRKRTPQLRTSKCEARVKVETCSQPLGSSNKKLGNDVGRNLPDEWVAVD